MIGKILKSVPEEVLSLFEAEKIYEAKNPNYMDLLAFKMQKQQLMKHLQIDLIKANPGYIECYGPMHQFMEQQDGILHGGMTSVLSDIVQGFAAFSLCSMEDKVVTAELNVSYFKPGKGDSVFARGWVEKAGSRLMFCEGEVYILNNYVPTLISKSKSIMAVI